MVKFLPQLVSNEGTGLDLRTYIASSKSYFKYDYLYSDSFQQKIINEMEENENYSIHRKAGFPNAVAVYFPQFVWLFYPFTLLEFKTAFFAFTFLSLLSIFISAFLVSKINKNISVYIILLFVFALKPTWYALVNGQPLFLATFFIIYSIYLLQNNKVILSAFVFSLSLFKPTLAVPFIFFYGLKNEWKWVSFVFLFGLFFNVFIVLNPFFILNFNGWKHNINSLFEYTLGYQQTNHLSINSTSIMVLISYFVKLNLGFLKIIPFVVLGIFIMMKKNWVKNHNFLSMILLTWFVFSHFLIYDLYFLLIIFLFSNDKQKFSTELLILFTTFLPMGLISDAIEMPWIKLYLPAILLIILLDKVWFKKLFSF